MPFYRPWKKRGRTSQPPIELAGQSLDEQTNQPRNEQENLSSEFRESNAELERDGLFIFEVQRPAGDYDIDIVAVHGLGGHWKKTWEAENTKIWLRDFLPTRLPRARIMSFGYNSDTAFSRAVTDIDDVATMLLDRLNNKRQLPEERRRPVILISHSLGGIVVKKALIIAHERLIHFEDLLNSVRGSVFFGVPHRGSDAAYWGTFAANVLKIVMPNCTNTNYITALQRNSGTFADISQQFIERAVGLQIRTFYETTTYYNQLIVDRGSARLGLPNEIAVGIAGTNHRNMVKFDANDTQKYSQVSDAVESLVNSAIAMSIPFPEALSEAEVQCLQCLYTSDYESHKRNVPPRVPGTLEWFLNHDGYKTWQHEQKSSLLWVSADPGCGKSVLASFLVDEFKSAQFQSTLPSTICYFFFKDGYEKRNNAPSALCALLHQLLTAKTPLIKHAMDDFRNKGQKFTDEPDALWRIFRAAAMDPGSGGVICVIDGLDECEQLTRDIFIDSLVSIHMLGEPAAQGTGQMLLKFIVTSRPYTSIEKKFTSLPSSRLKMEHQTSAISDDIKLVIGFEIEELGKHWSLSDGVRLNLQNRLCDGADRTFLWASLVLGILKGTDVGSEREFNKIVDSLPEDLDATYERILGNSSDPELAKYLLHIVVAAARPLTLGEIEIALAIQPHHKSIEDLGPDRILNIESTVKNLCGLFIRVIDSKIYLVHLTAREFLKGVPTTPATVGKWKHSLPVAESNLILASICLYYLQFVVFDTHPLVLDLRVSFSRQIDKYTRKHAFLDYAANLWLSHFIQARVSEEQEIFKSALDILETRPRRFQTWFTVYSYPTPGKNMGPFSGSRDMGDGELFREEVSILTVASYLGLGVVVRHLLKRGDDVNAPGGHYDSPLNTAAAQAHRGIVQILFDSGANVILCGKTYNKLSEVSGS